MRPLLVLVALLERKWAKLIFPFEVFGVCLTVAFPEAESLSMQVARMYLIIAHFAGAHSGEVYLDLAVANIALLVMNFFLVPYCRFVELDTAWVVGSATQNL